MKIYPDAEKRFFFLAALALIFLVFSGIKAMAIKGEEKILGVYLDSRGGEALLPISAWWMGF